MVTDNHVVLFARQPIFNLNCEVEAFELLYRGDDISQSGIDNTDVSMGDMATSNVLVEFFSNIPVDDFFGDKRVFINFTRNHILNDVVQALPKDRVVVELLEFIDCDFEVIKAVKELKEAGYTIALDDFDFETPARELIPYADIIKIDVLNKSQQDIIKMIEPVKDFNGVLLAEKVEDEAQFEFCKSLGFNQFQGFFLEKPSIVEGKEIGVMKTTLLGLLSSLQDPDVEFKDIEHIISTDPKFTYRILLLANSAAINRGKKVESIQEAFIRIGMNQIRTWANLLVLSRIDQTPPSLIESAIFRAKMCESLTQITGTANSQSSFTTGMVSTFEGILKISIDDILKHMNLTQEINQAILTQEGSLGSTLQMVKNLEYANFSKLNLNQLSDKQLMDLYLKNVNYAKQLIQDILKK